MCGRFALSAPSENIRKHFHLQEEVQLSPRYNIAPRQQIAVIRERETGENELAIMRWGLIPFWAKDTKISSKLINARAETLEEKPSFRTSFRKYRCLIPTNGFYEWQQNPDQKTKTPYFICLQNRGLFVFAGLWSAWTDKSSGELIESCTIITTEPNSLVAAIHNRMPVIIQPDQYAAWLNSQSATTELKNLFAPVESESMVAYPVTGLCNSSKNEGPECIKRAH